MTFVKWTKGTDSGWSEGIWHCTSMIMHYSFRLFGHSTTPPPPQKKKKTLKPNIEVGFKWMWTLLATQIECRAAAVVDLCAGLVVLLPRQIRRCRHGFFSSAVLDWSFRSCVSVRHLRMQQIADNWRYLRRSFRPRTPSLRSQISPLKHW